MSNKPTRSMTNLFLVVFEAVAIQLFRNRTYQTPRVIFYSEVQNFVCKIVIMHYRESEKYKKILRIK